MKQSYIHPPTITRVKGWPFFYRLYLHCVTWILRQLVSRLTGPNLGHDLEVEICTPDLGSGNVVCNVWMSKIATQSQQKYPLVLILEGGGFVLGHPKDGKLNNRRIVEQVRSKLILDVPGSKPT